MQGCHRHYPDTCEKHLGEVDVLGWPQRLGQEVSRVIVGAHEDKLDELAKELGDRAVVVPCDLADRESVGTLIDRSTKALDGLDILVNNAGMMQLSPIAGVEDESFERQIAVNLGGVFRGMREGGKRLREGGRIISFSSSVIGLYQPGYGVYAATKAGVEAMTHILAKELGSRGITVNAVAPGFIETDMTNVLDADTRQTLLAAIPLGRLGKPDDIAEAVCFLCGPGGAYITGTTLHVNGGMYMV